MPDAKPIIYFACSIRGGRAQQPAYTEIVNRLKKYAHVYGEEFAGGRLTESGTANMSDHAIYRRDIGWINDADAIVAEVTNPSLGVGYEIGYGLSIGKPVLALFRSDSGNSLSAMIAGNPDINGISYSDFDVLDRLLRDCIARLKDSA